MLEEDDVDPTSVKPCIHAEAMGGDVGVMHGSVFVGCRGEAEQFVVRRSDVDCVVDNNVDVGDGRHAESAISSHCRVDGQRLREVFSMVFPPRLVDVKGSHYRAPDQGSYRNKG